MSPRKLYYSVTKILASAPIVILSLVAIGLGIWTLNSPQGWESVFSVESLNELRALNYKHEMVLVEDLLDDNDSQMISSLYKADVLFLPGENEVTHKGLIVTISDDKAGDSVLLIEPTDPLDDIQLNAIAADYKSAIPELLDVEIDVELILSGEPVYHISPDSYRRTSTRRKDYSVYKNPIRVAVIDSGVDPNHEIFKNDILESGWNTVENSPRMYDDVGHGTHIAGIIRLNAPTAVIVPYKIVDANGGRLSNVIKAFDKAIDTRVDIINTSFGILSPSTALERVVDIAKAKDIIVVSAAGNLNTSKGFYPATFASTISVAGVDNAGNKMAKSNYGSWVDVASFGTYIWSSLPGNDYGHKSGTSQATAYVTAAIVHLIEDEGSMGTEEMLDRLIELGEPIDGGALAGLKIVK